jgi:glutathione S-transferase
MKLYDCATAPSPRRVRIFLAEKGLEVPRVEVDLRAGEHLRAPFRDLNPHCTVPVLEIEGIALCSTAAIWRYIEEICPEPPLLGRTALEKAKIADLQWRIESEGIMAVAEWLRNAAPGMKDRALTGPVDYAQIPQLAERGRKRAERFLHWLETQAASAAPYLCGEQYSVADIDALVCIDFARRLHLELPAEAAATRHWYALVASRPSAHA